MDKHCYLCKYYDADATSVPCIDCIPSGDKKHWTPVNDKDILITKAYVKAVELRGQGSSEYADEHIEDVIRLLAEVLSK